MKSRPSLSIEDGIDKPDESVLAKLGDGFEHVIHIMLQERGNHLAFSDEEFRNAVTQRTAT
jgi:hypothetical protein